MTSPSRLQVEISPITKDDFEDLAHAHLAAMKTEAVYLRFYSLSKRPTYEVQIRESSFLPFLLRSVVYPPYQGLQASLAMLNLLLASSSAENNILSRTSRAFPNPPPAHEIKATLPGSSKPIGFAYWEGPVVKTATLGGPTPEEALAAEKESAKEKTEEKMAWDATMDLDFSKEFLGESAKARREIMQGKEFWYLVSLVPLLDGRRGTESSERSSPSSPPSLPLSFPLLFDLLSQIGDSLRRPCVSWTWSCFCASELWDLSGRRCWSPVLSGKLQTRRVARLSSLLALERSPELKISPSISLLRSKRLCVEGVRDRPNDGS